MRRIRSVLVVVVLAASMLVAAAGPAQAGYEGARACDNWYFSDSGLGYRLSHCTNPISSRMSSRPMPGCICTTGPARPAGGSTRPAWTPSRSTDGPWA